MPDGPDGCAADFPHTLGNFVGHREELIAVIVEEQVVVAKMVTAHVPMEVLGFEIKTEDIREQRV